MNTQVGIEGRKQKRIAHKEKITAEALALFRKYFSEFLAEEGRGHSYEVCLQKIEDDICAKYKKKGDIETAWDVIAQEIEDGNERGHWQLDTPEVAVLIEAPIGLRDREFFYNVRALRLYDQEVIKGLDYIDFKNLSCAEILGGVLYFSIRGGLCQAEAVEEIPPILMGKKPFNIDSDGKVWAELEFQHNHLVTNVFDGEKKWTSKPWYVSSLALGLVQRYLKFSRLERKVFQKLDRNECLNLIRKFCFKLTRSIFPFKDLRALCRHMPGVIEMLDGVRLPEALILCLHGQTASVPLGKDYRVPCFVETPIRTSADLPEKQSDPIEWKAPDCNFVGLYEKLRNLLSTNSRKIAIEGLRQFLATESYHPSVKFILEWYLFNLKNKSWVPGTAERYHNAFFNEWISVMTQVDMEKLGGTEFFHLYQQMIDLRDKDSQKATMADRLNEFHHFAVKQCGFERLPSPIYAGGKEGRHVRAGYVTYANYQRLLLEISNLDGVWKDYREGMSVLVMLAYRTGMRLGELLHLQRKDFFDPNRDDDWFLRLRNTRLRRLKTESSKRKIPIAELLDDGELKTLSSFLKKLEPANLLFPIPNSQTVSWDATRISLKIGYLLKSISGIPSMVFHHFRHTALSNLHFAIEKEWAFFSKATGLSELQAQKARLAIVGVESNVRDAYGRMARFAGHASPQTTFLSYLHFSDEIVHSRIERSMETFPLTALRNLTALSVREIKQGNNGSMDLRYLNLPVCRPYILKGLKGHLNHVEIDPPLDVLPETEIDKEWCVTDNMPKVTSVLHLYDQGKREDEISYKKNLLEEVVSKIVEAASPDKESDEGLNRMIVKEGFIAPVPPAHNSDHQFVSPILLKLFSMGRKELDEFLAKWIKQINLSGSGFLSYCPEDTLEFINTFNPVLPFSRWRVVVSLSENENDVWQNWKEVLSGKVYSLDRDKNDLGQTSKLEFGRTKLFLRAPNESEILEKTKVTKDPKKYEKYSSNLIKSVLHTALIVRRVEKLMA